jgi:hypothetical protein
MRKFSGITNIQSPEAMCSSNIQAEQIQVNIDKDRCNPGRAAMNIQPYRTEFRNIFK